MGYTIVNTCVFNHIHIFIYTSDEYILYYYILYSFNEQYNDCVTNYILLLLSLIRA
jgi:hypothetical protein